MKERETAALLHRFSIHLLRQVKSVDPQSGLSAARLSALSVVVFAGPLNLSQLAEAEQVTSATMSRLVKALEQDALVFKATSKDDQREKWIIATRKGKQLLMDAQHRRLKLIEGKLKHLTTAELQEIHTALERLNKLLV